MLPVLLEQSSFLNKTTLFLGSCCFGTALADFVAERMMLTTTHMSIAYGAFASVSAYDGSWEEVISSPLNIED